MSLSGFKTFQRWSAADFEQFIMANHFRALRKELIKDIISLLYLVAESASQGTVL
jgi:hypothetical protein